jgi:multidrug efflux pump subunit AcrA (membrane-fusion protein)
MAWAALALAAFSQSSCRPRPEQVPEKPAPVTAFVAIRHQIRTVVDLAGTVEPQSRVTVYSRVSGEVKSVAAGEGDRVARNGLLAQVIQDQPGSDFLPHPVRSPIAGTVLRALVSQGAAVGPQTPLFEVGDTRCINFEGQIFGEDRARVRLGQRLMVAGQGGDTLLGLTVTRLAPQLDPVTGGQKLEATVCLMKNPLLVGQSVTGHVEVGRLEGIMVPRMALARDSLGREGIYRISGDSAAFMPVKVLNRSLEHFLVEGLPEGTVVAAEGAGSLRPGSKVTVVEGSR